MKISVCLTTYNGELFLKQQLDSIINQLPINGEIIISDDGSIDQTLNLLESFSQQEPRIKLFKNNFKSVKKNFEFTLKQCTGDYIFLSDQDDIWKPDKIETTLIYFSNGYDLVLSDCFIINSDNIIVNNSFFALNNSSSGFLKNIYRNSYIGCCMAFKRNILDCVLPFPNKIPMHDVWIGLNAELFFKPIIINQKLIFYRTHNNNVTKSATGVSSNSILSKVSFRIILLFHIIKKIIFNK